MNISAFIGGRYYRARAGNGFVSLITLVSFLGMVLGVIALVVVVSVMNGFDKELKKRILGAVPHVVIEHESPQAIDALLPEQGITAITPFMQQEALLVSGGNTRLMMIYGVDPTREAGASTIADAMLSGDLASISNNDIVLGQSIARRLGVGLGDSVSLVIPRLSAAGGTIAPKLVTATVGGTFLLGSELDMSLAVMNLDSSSGVFEGPVSTRITLEDIFDAPRIRASLALLEQPVTDWSESYGDFFQTVRMEKIMMFVLLSFVVAIASFSIVSGLTMLVESKRRDIAVLQTMGLSAPDVMAVFLYQGIGIGVTGVLAGLLFGIPLAFYAPQIMAVVEGLFGFSIVQGTYFDQIPTDVRLVDTVVIALVALLISVTATLYPAWRAAGLHPAAVLRYE